MGPDFSLQRIRVENEGYVVDPPVNGVGDCDTLHLKHPDYVVKAKTVIPLIASYYEEPGKCNNSE